MDKQEAMKELAKRELAKREFTHYVPYIFPSYVREDFHEVFHNSLQDVVEGRIKKLMVFLPPRSGKSQDIGKHSPL